jgi:hypothetical protein
VKPLRAAHLGEPGFVSFIYELQRLAVIDRAELRGWLELHGSVLRSVEPRLDRGQGVPGRLVERLLQEAAE